MKAIRKQIRAYFDIAVVLSDFALVMILIGHLIPYPQKTTPDCVPDEATEVSSYEIAKGLHGELKEQSKKAESERTEYAGHFAEEVSEEMNCLFYATVPVGRYYITAYNHEETGSKITASGKNCHEGTITTCAIDPKLHRFGEYFEITVNGQPRLFVAEDTGRLVRNRHVDLYFSSYKAMARYGSNYQTIYRVEFPFGKPKEA